MKNALSIMTGTTSPRARRARTATLVGGTVLLALVVSSMPADAGASATTTAGRAPVAATAAVVTRTVRDAASPATGARARAVVAPRGAATATASTTTTFGRGTYAGIGANGVIQAKAFDQATGTFSSTLLDFPPMNSWSQIEGQSWLLQQHGLESAQLEYSLPIVPSISGASLGQCASGAYNSHWTKLAQNLISFHLATAIIRPGWEMNGSWYAWSAAKNPADFISCFRNVVTSMRQVAGQHFLFDWNVSNGKLSIAAELAYPGDQYVDIIGDDVYDTSWTWYSSAKAPSADDQRKAVAEDINGNHDLQFWSDFARTHGKQLALTEWGLAHRSDGRGGEDNTQFVQAMYDFMANPVNNVRYEHYFNSGTHVLTGATAFPRAAALFRALFHNQAAAQPSGVALFKP